MPKMKFTSRAKHPDKTEAFVTSLKTAMEDFEDEISSLTPDTCHKAYKKFVKAYKEALTAVWDLAQFADVTLVLQTIDDREMLEIAVMACKLTPLSPMPQVVKEKMDIPTSETITSVFTQRYPDQDLPSSEVCQRIGDIFSKISKVNRAYREAAEMLAEISTELSPQQYTVLLTVAATPTIQIIVPPKMISPVAAPALQPQEGMTQLGRAAIIDATKLKVLPNPDAPCLQEVNTHTPTRVLAAAVYTTLEKKFFDTTYSRMDIASAFKCNASQVSKAVTGIEYHSGPHHYKLKSK